MKTLKINQFKLFYDGMFRVEFNYQNNDYDLKIFLEPKNLLKLLQNENLDDQLESINFLYYEGVNISNTILSFPMFEEDKISFCTSEYCDEEYLDKDIIVIECEFIFSQ